MLAEKDVYTNRRTPARSAAAMSPSTPSWSTRCNASPPAAGIDVAVQTMVSTPLQAAATDQGSYVAGLLAELPGYSSTDESCGSDDKMHGWLLFEA